MGAERDGEGNTKRTGGLGPGSVIDAAFGRLETLFEVGASALVPIATLAFPVLLGIVSFIAFPEMGHRERGETDPGEGYRSLEMYAPEAGDAPPEPEPEPEPEPVAPKTKGTTDGAKTGTADEKTDAKAGEVTPDGPGEGEATAPEAREGTEDGTATEVAPKAGKAGKTGGKSSRCVEKPNPQIVSIGEKKWSIERDLLDFYATHFKALDSLGYVEHWKAEDGSAKGFRIGGVRCNNDLYLSGFRSGDVVLAVNEHKVSSIPEALAVYAKYRKSDVIKIKFLRKGVEREHLYRLK